MPIIEDGPIDGVLRQGDLLHKLRFFASGPDGPDRSNATMAVVLSRDCNALRDERVVVAVVQPFKNKEKVAEIFDEVDVEEVRRKFNALRDGSGPDTIYIGHLPGADVKQPRHAIWLKELHTLIVSTDPAKRVNWVSTHRFARLETDFVRHLQSRLFNAITRQGFDDYRWWSDHDLEEIVSVGLQQLKQLELDRDQQLRAARKASAAGQDEKQVRGREGLAQKTGSMHARVVARLKPYQEELMRRDNTRLSGVK